MPKYKPGDLVIVHGPTCEIAGFTFGAPIPWNDDMDRYKGRTLRVCRVTGYGTIRLAPADDTLIRDLGYDFIADWLSPAEKNISASQKDILRCSCPFPVMRIVNILGENIPVCHSCKKEI
jgi:hypothetical protein